MTGAIVSPQPKTGAPLSSEDVGLLVAGDVLRHAEGVFRHVRVRDCGDVVVDAPVLTPYDRPEAFTFIGRPDADGWIPAPEGGWGENPVPGMVVQVRYRGAANEPPLTAPSEERDWTHDKRYPGSDIIAIRLPDHISSAGEKVEPANGEVAAAVEGGARMAGVVSMLERVIGPTASVRIYEHEAKLILTALRAQPNGGAK